MVSFARISGIWEKRIILGIALAWIPLVIFTATQDAKNLHGLLTDYRVYARAFLAISLLLMAQIGMERRFREMSRYFLDANLVRAQDLGVFQSICKRHAACAMRSCPKFLSSRSSISRLRIS